MTGALSLTNAYFGQGSGPIQLNNVQCSGSEVTLLQCSHSTINSCGHYEDAGIRCPGIQTAEEVVYCTSSCHYTQRTAM